MGEVIQFPGNREKKNNQGETLNMGKFTILLETLTSLFETQPSLRKNIAFREDYLKDTTDRELVRIVNHSTEADWTQRPAYYAAIIKRFNDAVDRYDSGQE